GRGRPPPGWPPGGGHRVGPGLQLGLGDAARPQQPGQQVGLGRRRQVTAGEVVAGRADRDPGPLGHVADGQPGAQPGQGQFPAGRTPAPVTQVSGAASSVMSTAASALLTGQPSLASWAAFANPASSRPSTSARTVSLIPVIMKPPAGSGPSVTSARTSSAWGV